MMLIFVNMNQSLGPIWIFSQLIHHLFYLRQTYKRVLIILLVKNFKYHIYNTYLHGSHRCLNHLWDFSFILFMYRYQLSVLHSGKRVIPHCSWKRKNIFSFVDCQTGRIHYGCLSSGLQIINKSSFSFHDSHSNSP